MKSHSNHLQWRRTKIIATLGPATNSAMSVKKLMLAGVNVFRLNMSHSSHAEHKKTFRLIRKIAAELELHIGILMDLCGPKIRVGEFESGEISLVAGEDVVVSCRKIIGKRGLIPSQYLNLYKDVKPKERIFLDDGNMELRVKKIDGKQVFCKIIHGGILKDHKGVNLPDTEVSASSLTIKDRQDANLAIELGADFVALSFVRSAKELKTLKRYMKKSGSELPVIAKIERPEAIENVETTKEIILAADGIMIARGDLGIELPAEQVPLIQKKLILLARYYHRPVIVATQMMESMIEHSRPTRAEVADVANAALNCTDAVMLSAETAVGKYPVDTVKNMDRILREIELHQWQEDEFSEIGRLDSGHYREISARQAIASAACSLARELRVQGIIVPTTGGTTAQVLSANRPASPLIGVSSDAVVCRRLSLHWGIIPYKIKKTATRDWKSLSCEVARKFKLTRTGNTVLLVSGFHADTELSEPVIKVTKV